MTTHTPVVPALFVLLSCGTLATAQQGLVAHFPFDEGSGTVVRDASGNGHDGAVHGATFVQLTEGYALDFDGQDDYVEIPDAPDLRLTETLSVEAWVNARANSTGTIVAKNGSSTYRQNYRLGLEENAIVFGLVEHPGTEKTGRGTGIDRDKWYHLVGVYDGAGVRIYINGARTGSKDMAPFIIGTMDQSLYVGVNFYANGLHGHFTGLIDDVRIYNRALGPEQVLANYQAGKDLRVSELTMMLAQVSSFEPADTTPPTANLARPPLGSTTSADATISARFEDNGSGIDLSSARITLDASDVTADADITREGVTFTPPGPLANGIHRVTVTVSDRAGNASNQLSWRFGVGAPVPTEAKFEQGVFLVDDEPYFPLGIYCSNTSHYRKLPYLAEAAAAGINYKVIGERGAQQVLDDLLKDGMKGLTQVYYAAEALGNGDQAPLEEVVALKNHPAMLGWWNEFAGETQSALATRTYEFIKQRDPRHPILFMLQWGGRISDAYYVYNYPILNPIAPGDDIISLYDPTLKNALEAAQTQDKQVWFISQALDYRIADNSGEVPTLQGGFRPSREEIRAMNYLALAKGARGLMYYASGPEIADTRYADDITIYPRQWTEALKIASEVRHLAPVLAAGTPATTARLEDAPAAIHFLELARQGVHTLIAVNVERERVLANWSFDQPVQPQVLFEDRVLPGEAQAFTDLFQPLEVHIYQWKPGAPE